MKAMESLMIEKWETLLRNNNLRVTNPRIQVLDMISGRVSATSQPELEMQLGKDIDRVTLYRILNVFEEKGIIHKVFNLHGTATYALCSPSCNSSKHHDEHLHFTCKICDSVYCFNDTVSVEFPLPEGFSASHFMISAIGVCDQCTKEVS